MRGKKLIVGFLVLLITSSIIYIALQGEGVKLRVDSDKTTLYVFEDSRWKIGGREYNKLFDGTRRLYRDVSNVKIYTHINETTNTTTIIRETPYKRGPFIRDTYYFRGDVKDKKLFPIYHKVEIYNASGLFYRYEVRDLVYAGPTRKLKGETYLRFGRNVVVKLNSGYRWAWVYKSGIVKAQYDIKSDYEVFNIRLFDPDLWWNTSWAYRQPINISNTAGDLTNYQVRIDLNSSNVGPNFNWSNNGDDLRFTNTTNDLLDYWIEYWNDTEQEATIWVNVTHLANNTNTTIYMYYGNPSAGSASSGSNTMLIYEDMETEPTGNLSGDAVYNSTNKYVMLTSANGDEKGFLYYSQNPGNGFYARFKFWTGNGNGADAVWLGAYDTQCNNTTEDIVNGGYHYTFDEYQDRIAFTKSTSDNGASICEDSETNLDDGNWHSAKIYFWSNSSGTSVKIYYDGTLRVSCTDTNPQSLTGNYFFWGARTGGLNNEHRIDDLIVAKYVFPEPSVSSFGDEESVHITYTVLYLDGISADRYYEHGTVAVLKANVTNSTGDLISDATVCLDIDQVGYGDNYICDNGTVEYNLTANAILGEFNDSTTAKNLTYTNAPENQTFYIKLNKYDEVQSAYINVTGFQNPDWPLNFKIYINDTLVDSIIGYLGVGNQTLNELSNGNIAENLSFSGEGTKKRYLRLPKNANVTSAYLDVSGYLGYTYWYDAETSWSYTGGWSSTHPASKCVDENWGSFGETVGGYVYENFSLSLENIHYINWYAHLATSTYSSYQTTNISLWNYSSNSWSLIYNFTHNETGYAYVHVYPNITIHNSVFINNTTPLQVKTFVTTYYYEGKVRFEQNPYNTYIGVGSGKVWNWSGEFTTDNGTQTVNLNATLINDYLSTCSADSEGYCNVPILFYSGSAGILEVSNIEVNYTYIVEPTRNINATAIQNYLDAQSSSGYYNIPVKISSETNSTIQVSNINITYYGSDNITVTAHFDGDANYNASNDTHVVKVVYSRFNTTIPVNYGYLEFIPNSPTDKNVTAYGQTEAKPALNISWLNYDQPANLSMKINETHPCINITVSTTYNKSAGYVLNTSYIQLDSNKNLTNNTYLYLWADYSCNYTDPYWRYWLPEFLLKACAINAVKCD